MGKDYRSRYWMVSKKNRINYRHRIKSGVVKLIAPITFNIPKDGWYFFQLYAANESGCIRGFELTCNVGYCGGDQVGGNIQDTLFIIRSKQTPVMSSVEDVDLEEIIACNVFGSKVGIDNQITTVNSPSIRWFSKRNVKMVIGDQLFLCVCLC